MSKKVKKALDKAIDILLACIIIDAAILLTGTICFTLVYIKTGGVPDSVVAGFFADFGLEVVACTAIKIVKTKYPKEIGNG